MSLPNFQDEPSFYPVSVNINPLNRNHEFYLISNLVRSQNIEIKICESIGFSRKDCLFPSGGHVQTCTASKFTKFQIIQIKSCKSIMLIREHRYTNTMDENDKSCGIKFAQKGWQYASKGKLCYQVAPNLL